MAEIETKKSGTDAYTQKIRRHRSRIRRLQLLVVVLLAACVVLVVWLWQSRRYTRTELTKISDFVAEEGAQYLDLNGCIVQYGPNGAACINSSGKIVWNVTYEMDRPIVSTAETLEKRFTSNVLIRTEENASPSPKTNPKTLNNNIPIKKPSIIYLFPKNTFI